MQQYSIYQYYAFGFNYGLVLTTGLLGKEKADALETLDSFFRQLQQLDLQVTSLVANDLQQVRDRLKESEDATVSSRISNEMQSAASRIDATLDAELKLRKAYVLTKKRYPLESLLEVPKELLGSGVWEKLSDNAKKDFRLATTQVALLQPTASAFHLMRALEDHVRTLYWAYKKTNRLVRPMWGAMTAELRSKRGRKPSNKLLDHLDGMRVHFRNPTQHPDAFYTADECQDLLNQTITALNMISVELPE